jgi:hypothetical protein
MNFAALALAALAFAAASPTSAEVAGPWHVSGRVASFAFTLNCDFKPEGSSLGGVCTDASTNDPKVNTGKSHVLTSGSVEGDKVSWTYQSSFLFTKFDVAYSGVQTGDRIAGTIHAQGRDGTFTATRP